MFCPQATEEIEEDAEDDAEDETDSVTADSVEPGRRLVEDKTAYDALQKVVRKAHLTDAFKVSDCIPYACAIV